ncbi:MAG: pantoate--beta-alanine ligase [Nitrospinaceae bacterium]|nr:pantoate--beta-alanine ligase [Nitrospinaceae bacterium]
MDIVDSPAKMRTLAGTLRAKCGTLGLVPTMGALHEGHTSLIASAVSECASVVVSIFVNPAQFAPTEDLDTYPRTFELDLEVCRSRGVAAVYAPTPEAMYQDGFDTWIEVPSMSAGLCGLHRPGHFRGVVTIVAKLFNACKPDRAYFGEKDFQQFVLIRHMSEDLDFGVNVIACPIVREKDGLAMSSRNVNLSGGERERALCLIKGLRPAKQLFLEGEKESARLCAVVREELEKAHAQVDYVEIIASDTLEPLESANKFARIAVAANIGSIRLIDNLALGD